MSGYLALALSVGLLAGLKPEQAILPTVASVIIGAVFGIVSEKLAEVLTKKAPAA